MARSRKRDVWADWMPPGPKVEAGESEGSPPLTVADAAEPSPRVNLDPMFPIGGIPFTPSSPCPHWCKRCRGSGVIGIDEEMGTPVECPDCFDEVTKKGTGESRPGAPFVCMCCDRSGLDGSPALPLDVEPLPLGPPMGDEGLPDAKAIRREKARLEAYVRKALRRLEGSPENP